MTIYDLKPRFQDLLRPLTKSLAANGVTANQVTIAAALLSFATGAVLVFLGDDHRWYLLVPLMLFVRMALNAIDGMLAREHGQKSRLGAILNELGDIFSDSALYFPFALLPAGNPALAIAVVWLAVVSEVTGILAQTIDAERRYDGPMGKSDRAFWFSLLSLALGCGVTPGPWLDVFWFFLIALLAVTILNRARRALSNGGT